MNKVDGNVNYHGCYLAKYSTRWQLAFSKQFATQSCRVNFALCAPCGGRVFSCKSRRLLRGAAATSRCQCSSFPPPLRAKSRSFALQKARLLRRPGGRGFQVVKDQTQVRDCHYHRQHPQVQQKFLATAAAPRLVGRSKRNGNVHFVPSWCRFLGGDIPS
jgi:hypothetical protein